MDTDIPDAAIERAIKESKSCLSVAQVRQRTDWPVYLAILNHARLIAKYEPQTLVDPLVRVFQHFFPNDLKIYRGDKYMPQRFRTQLEKHGFHIVAKANPDDK